MPKSRRRSRARPGALPKGAYRLPSGNYVVTGPWSEPNKRGRRIRIVAVHRDDTDVDKVVRALLDVVTDEQHRGQD
jgi:hypothetical protein